MQSARPLESLKYFFNHKKAVIFRFFVIFTNLILSLSLFNFFLIFLLYIKTVLDLLNEIFSFRESRGGALNSSSPPPSGSRFVFIPKRRDRGCIADNNVEN